jgi:hypothetical protein
MGEMNLTDAERQQLASAARCRTVRGGHAQGQA